MLQPLPNELEAIHQTLHRLEQRWVLPIPDAHTWFAYHPLPIAMFLPGIRQASELTDGRRFLDIGCGIGTKLALMHTLGWEVAGIDRTEHYLDAARELIPEATLTHADALALNSFNADLVYMYRPAVSDKLETELERHVLAHVKPGTVCFFPTRRQPDVWII
jgi:2-polyprenyl-3-methyl-5-hydroxy-6-metoxy-1,4-benzoquinol methylase